MGNQQAPGIPVLLQAIIKIKSLCDFMKRGYAANEENSKAFNFER